MKVQNTILPLAMAVLTLILVDDVTTQSPTATTSQATTTMQATSIDNTENTNGATTSDDPGTTEAQPSSSDANGATTSDSTATTEAQPSSSDANVVTTTSDSTATTEAQPSSSDPQTGTEESTDLTSERTDSSSSPTTASTTGAQTTAAPPAPTTPPSEQDPTDEPPPGNYPRDKDVTDEIKDYERSYGFEILIVSETLITFNETEFMIEMEPFYDNEDLPGFKEFNIVDIRTGSVIVNYTVVYTQVLLEDYAGSDVSVEYVYEKSLQRYYDDPNAKYSLNETFTQYEELESGNLCEVEAYCDDNYECTVSDNPLKVLCESSSQCLEGYCKNDGYCTHDEDNNPVCWCPSDSQYWYRGETCEHRVNRVYLILAISGGLLLLVIIFSSVVCCVATCCRGSDAEEETQKHEEVTAASDAQPEENEHFHRFLETFQMPEMYQPKTSDSSGKDVEETKLGEPSAVIVGDKTEIPSTEYDKRLSGISDSAAVYADASSYAPNSNYQGYIKPVADNRNPGFTNPDFTAEEEGAYSTNIPHNPREQVALAYEAKNLVKQKRISREIEDTTAKYAPYGYPTSGTIPEADYM
ncbi:interphotoreceptor matrix proteoglycan 2-like isoform X2 [Ptychodera flava]|uniref:interphotoreceptor matrix proteoglycan 2-like isoform X2 n=1 Tax=Ptychodera flava TaxID=63121 RepID=UPI00396A8C08